MWIDQFPLLGSLVAGNNSYYRRCWNGLLGQKVDEKDTRGNVGGGVQLIDHQDGISSICICIMERYHPSRLRQTTITWQNISQKWRVFLGFLSDVKIITLCYVAHLFGACRTENVVARWATSAFIRR